MYDLNRPVDFTVMDKIVATYLLDLYYVSKPKDKKSLKKTIKCLLDSQTYKDWKDAGAF